MGRDCEPETKDRFFFDTLSEDLRVELSITPAAVFPVDLSNNFPTGLREVLSEDFFDALAFGVTDGLTSVFLVDADFAGFFSLGFVVRFAGGECDGVLAALVLLVLATLVFTLEVLVGLFESLLGTAFLLLGFAAVSDERLAVGFTVCSLCCFCCAFATADDILFGCLGEGLSDGFCFASFPPFLFFVACFSTAGARETDTLAEVLLAFLTAM